MIENDTRFRCNICGKEGSVGRCCSDNDRTPLNDLAITEMILSQTPAETLEVARQIADLTAEIDRLRALVSMAVDMLTFEYTAGDGVPEKFSAEWDLLLRQAQEGRG